MALLGKQAQRIFTPIVDPEHAEVLALRKAVELYNELRLGAAVVERGTTTVISSVCSNETDLSPLGSMVDDIRNKLQSMHCIDVKWVSRKCNAMAYHLAQYAKTHDQEVYWSYNPPSFLGPLLHADLSATHS